jgi:MFS family permease
MMGFTPNFWLFVCWNVLAGLSIPFGSIPVNTYMQLTVPDSYRGRVNSAWTTASVGVQPVGLFLGGLLVQYAGIVGGFVVMGTGMIVSGAIGLLDRKFRQMTMPEQVDRSIEVAEPALAAEAC